MAEPGRAPGRMQGYAGTWPPRSAAAAGGLAPSGFHAWSSFTAKLREWAAAEAGAGRLFPWVPVAFGVGIAVYFAADHEPALSVSVVVVVAESVTTPSICSVLAAAVALSVMVPPVMVS